MLLGMLGFAFVWIAELPFGLAQLWWDRRHDVSEQGYIEWALNSFLGLGGTFLFICVAIGIVMALARPLRERWWIPGAAVFVGLGLLFTFLGPYLVPDQHPLRNERLAAEADRLAHKQGVPDIPVRVEDVDQFTDEPNAFATGLGPTRRVILWNTLLDPPFSDREVRVVIAHELGHHSRDHLWKLSAWFALVAVPMAWIIAMLTRRRGGMYEARAVPLALLIWVVLQVAISPAQNALTRRYEAEADWVALETSRDPRAAAGAVRGAGRDEQGGPEAADMVLRPVRHPPDHHAAHRDGRGLAGSQRKALTAAPGGRVALEPQPSARGNPMAAGPPPAPTAAAPVSDYPVTFDVEYPEQPLALEDLPEVAVRDSAVHHRLPARHREQRADRHRLLRGAVHEEVAARTVRLLAADPAVDVQHVRLRAVAAA